MIQRMLKIKPLTAEQGGICRAESRGVNNGVYGAKKDPRVMNALLYDVW